MGWFQNEYEDKLSELKGGFFENLTGKAKPNIDYELRLMEGYEQKISKIIKILEKYDNIKDELNKHYNVAIDNFDDSKRSASTVRGTMLGEVSPYVSSFDEKISEILEKLDKKKSNSEDDEAMIKRAMKTLKERKNTLHNNFYNQYNLCKNKLNK